MTGEEKLMTVKELSHYLRLSLPETYKLLKSNALVHFRVGKGRGAIRIRKSDVVDFLAARQRGPTPVVPPRIRSRPLKHIR
jgi:excisionase family DNA binding protein